MIDSVVLTKTHFNIRPNFIEKDTDLVMGFYFNSLSPEL